MHHLYFLIALAVSVISIGLGAFWIFEEDCLFELALGWGLAFFNHCFEWFLAKKGLSRGIPRFFLYCVGLNGVRVIVLFLAIVGVIYTMEVSTAPFIYGVFTTYFIFLTFTVLYGHLRWSKARPGGSVD